MKIAGQTVTIVLTKDGRNALALAKVRVPKGPVVLFFVQDTDDVGLWVRHRRPDGEHVVLVRWDFVLSLDFAVGEAKAAGFK